MNKILSLGVFLIGISVACCASAQTILTIAGNGAVGFAGDNGLATAAMLNHPRGMAADAAGNIYLADLDNSRIRKISVSGIITTVAGNGTAGYSGDGGAAVNAMLNGPQAVAIDPGGNLIIADTQNRCLRKVNTSGTITTIAGTGTEGYSGDGGLATQAMLHQAVDVAIDSGGTIYFADSTGHRVRRITPDGIISTVAGNGTGGYSGDGGFSYNAQLNFPVSVAVDSSDQLYIADGNNFRIRKVNTAAIISTVVGNGQEGFSGDGGAATSAMINYSYGVRLDSQGRLFIADTSNNRIRVVANGTISTLAGTGADGFAGDGGAATSAMLSFPWSVAIDGSGNLLIGDRVNDRVREVTIGNVVKTPPAMFPNGMVNGASYASAVSANGAIAPGSIVAIFGSSLATGNAAAPSTPLPTTLLSTSVTMNGTPVPLFYVSSGQINAQAPFELSPGSVSVQVSQSGQTTVAQAAQVATMSPGVFTLNAQGTGDGAFLHGNFSPVNSASPAQTGETILIYCTGLGVTSPRVPTGNPAPGSPTAQVFVTPTVTIGGKSSFVSFAGLAPGFVGLYQINAQIPAGLPSGSQQVLVQMNGVQSNVTTVATR